MKVQEVLVEGLAVSLKDFEKAIDALVTKGKDFVTVNMVQTELNNITKKTVDGTAVSALCKKHLKPAVGKANYFDAASYGSLAEGKVSLGAANRKKVYKDQDYQQGDRFDPGNPAHEEERDKRAETEKKRKEALKNWKSSNYPIFDHEFKRRLFDPEFVNEIVDDFGGKKEWDKMDELEQIKCQLSFIAPPPRRGVSVAQEEAALEKEAKALQAKIKRT